MSIICRELLLGLEYLHQNGKIHRDIKAANILLTQSGRVKIADFGVAAQLNSIKSMRNTLVGTPFWMAPEVIQEEGHDFKADIWSLGITAMELINGVPPHADMHPMKALFHIPRSEAPRLEGHQFSRGLKDFVAACLIKDPDQRPTASSLLQHRFVRLAGKIEGLQEVIERAQQWEAEYEQVVEPRYYQETMQAMSPVEEDEEWTFDTVKASTVGTFNSNPFSSVRRITPTVRKISSTAAILPDDTTPESMISRLTLSENDSTTSTQDTPNTTPASTVRRTPAKRLRSPTTSDSISSVRRKSMPRKSSLSSNASPTKTIRSSVRKPLGADMSFGNGASTMRQFSRVSNNSAEYSDDGFLVETTDENRPPFMESITKEALVGRRACDRVVEPALQEVLTQTGNYEQREAIKDVVKAWKALDLKDPEGEFLALKLIIQGLSK